MKLTLNFRFLKLTVLTFILCFISVYHAEAKDIGWGIPKGENHEQPWPGKEFDEIVRQINERNCPVVFLGDGVLV